MKPGESTNRSLRYRLLRRIRDEDDGSTLLLTIFYAMLSIAVILVVVAATSLYIERKRLFTLADGAALDGAETFELDQVKMGSRGYRPVLKSDAVAGAVQHFVHDHPGEEFSGLRIDRALSVDGRSATVELSANWSPPIVSLLVPNGFRISVTAVARSVFS